MNPNGPITIGSGRGAAYGSTLANVLEAAGNVVHREYYINDGVNSEQMRLFAESVRTYLLGFVYGEWTGEQLAEDGDSVRLDLLNDWWSSAKPKADSSDLDLYKSYQSYAAKLETLSARNALANHSDSQAEDYRRDRPVQLKRLIKTNRLPLSDVLPEKGYRGVYVRDVATEIVNQGFDQASRLAEGSVIELQSCSQDLMLKRQREDLAQFGVVFDTWFSEQSLHDAGVVAARIDELIQQGVADTQPQRTKLKLAKGGKIDEVITESQVSDEDDVEGAEPTLWLRSTEFGDDMDRVLRRRDGRLTYIASDIAYHADKFSRPEGADKLITILGPDHHGYIGRLTAVLAALRYSEASPVVNDAELTESELALYGTIEKRNQALGAVALAKLQLEVVIYQLVRFLKEGKPAPMRKRDGNIYELRDLIREIGTQMAPDAPTEEQTRIGRDVSRFFYLMRSADTTMDFDIDLATKNSDENPVFYVQYAHARICSVISKAAEAGLQPDVNQANLLVHDRERALIKKIADLPYEVARIANDYSVHRLTTYAAELARTYHYFYDGCRVIQTDQPELSQARLALCEAARRGLFQTLALLGISAPERM